MLKLGLAIWESRSEGEDEASSKGKGTDKKEENLCHFLSIELYVMTYIFCYSMRSPFAAPLFPCI